MKRTLLSILAVTMVSLSGQAQFVYDRLDRHPDVQGPTAYQWQGWTEVISTEMAQLRLTKIIKSKYFKGFKEDQLKEQAKNVNWADFDGDGDFDIIYSGRYHKKMESDVTMFFRNVNEEYELVCKFNGILAMILRMNGRVRRSRFIILDEAYPGKPYSQMTYMYFNGKEPIATEFIDLKKNGLRTQFNSDSLGASVVRKFTYMNRTLFPQNMGDEPLSIARVGAYLTPRPAAPDNADFSQDISVFSDSTIAKNKAIAVLDVGTNCRAIGITRTDGHLYYMVMLNYEAKENNYLSDFNGFLYGWVDSEYVKKKEARMRPNN